jgi:hypothetical protein
MSLMRDQQRANHSDRVDAERLAAEQPDQQEEQQRRHDRR